MITLIYSAYDVNLIDCKINDLVYVYKNKIEDYLEIDKEMIGVVEDIKQYIDTDWIGMNYLIYQIRIKLKNGQEIKIVDNRTKDFFRKYEFITIKDLKRLYNIDIEDIQ